MKPIVNEQTSGFTLVELMIVTAVIGVIAGVAVPNLVSSRAVANERTVVATLRTVATAQTQCKIQIAVDVDRDGIGEALGLGEMAATQDLRSGGRLSPPCIATSMGTLDSSGYVHAKGYLMALYLPDAAGTGVLATPANAPLVDADQAELAWSCVAWPLTLARTGSASYFLNQSGEILVAHGATYDGAAFRPPAGAGLLGVIPTQIVGGTIAANTVGADGNLWRTLR